MARVSSLNTPMLKITSDGTLYDTKVIHLETGADLSGYVTKVSWSIDAASGMPMAEVTFLAAALDVVTPAQIGIDERVPADRS